VKISEIDRDGWEVTTKRIKEENSLLHPGLKIVGARWSSSAGKPAADGKKKRYSSLIVSVDTPEMVDEMIREGVVDGA